MEENKADFCTCFKLILILIFLCKEKIQALYIRIAITWTTLLNPFVLYVKSEPLKTIQIKIKNFV